MPVTQIHGNSYSIFALYSFFMSNVRGATHCKKPVSQKHRHSYSIFVLKALTTWLKAITL